MILLGRWQLHVSERKHFDIQNFGYALQWWLFAGFAAFFWWRIVRDAARRSEDAPTPAEPEEGPSQPVAYRRYVMPPRPVIDAQQDPELAAYNDYLARLADAEPANGADRVTKDGHDQHS
jgi:DNA-binding transcriptional regulator of glucitol operon